MRSSLVSEFASRRRSGETFDDFMRDHPTVETSVLIQIIGEDQRLSEENEFRGLETYLQKIPELKEDSEAVLEAMYSEWLILEEAGESIDGESYIKCFPDLEEEIRRQLQVHQALKFDESVEIGLCDTPEANADATVREVIEAPPAQPEFDDLQIGKLAGKGGMGVVFLGRSKTLGRDVAVKVLSRSVQPDSAEARRMEREARIVASLDDPNIVKIYDVRRDQNGLPVILMEYVDGGTLARKLANGPLPPREAASILEAIAGGLATAHASDLIHRDLKPANILLTKDGSPKVADFGLARAIEPGSINATTMTNFVGTPSYVSPEQARAEPSAIRPASDVYSLGVILYETLTGRPPFQAATAWEVVSDILNEDITPIRQLNRRVPTDLETICHHCLERSVDRRYQNATELREDLKRYLDGRPILAKPTPLHRRIISWVKRHPSLSAAAGIAGVALLSIAAVSLRSSSKIRVSLDRTSAALEDAAMQRDVAVKAMNDLVYTVHDELQTREASIEARGEVLKSAMLGLQRVIDTSPDDIESALTMADAENRFAYILSQQNRNDEALSEFRKAIARVEAIEGEKARRLEALIRLNLGTFFSRSVRFQEAITSLSKSLLLSNQLLNQYPEDEDLLNLICKNKSRLGGACSSLGRVEDSNQHFQEAIPIAEQLFESSPDSLQRRFNVTELRSMLGLNFMLQGQFDRATESYRGVIDLLEPLDPSESEDVQLRTNFYNAKLQIATIQIARQNFADGVATLTDVATAYERLIDAEPNRTGFRLRMGAVQDVLAATKHALRDRDAAKSHALRSIEALEAAIRMDPSAEVQKSQIASRWSRIADFELRNGDLNAAQKAIDNVIENLRPLVERYQMHVLFSIFETWSAHLRAVQHGSSDIDEERISAIRLSLDVLAAAHQDKFETLRTQIGRLEDDIDAAESPAMKNLLAKWLAVSVGEWHYWETQQGNTSADKLDQIAETCITAVRRYLAQPNAETQFPNTDPAFATMRDVPEFAEAFPIP